MPLEFHELSIEQAVAALVSHYVAASVGLVDENIEASYGYQKFALLFQSGVECTDRATGDFVEARKRSGRVGKKKDCTDEASGEQKKGSEPLNAFFAFARERKEEIASAASLSGNVHISTAQKIKEMWEALPGDEKEKYSSESSKVQRKALVSSAAGALQLPHAISIFETGASSLRGNVPLGNIGLTATVNFRRKFNLKNFIAHASCVPSLSILSGSFSKMKGGNSRANIENGLTLKMELAGHPGKFVTANLYLTGVVKVTLAKTELALVFDQIRDSLNAVNATAQAANPPVSVFESSAVRPLAWCALKLALIKKQFDLGFRIKYSNLASLLLTLEGVIFSDIRTPGIFGLTPQAHQAISANLDADGFVPSGVKTGSGIFARFIRRNEQDGDVSFFTFHTGIVQINGSRGATVASLQSCANALFAFLTAHRHVIQPSSEMDYEGSRRKRKRILWQMGAQDPGASQMRASV